MTDKRWFYRDPLEAMYMAKHYGVKLEGFVRDHDEPVEFERFTCTAQPYSTLWGHVIASTGDGQKWYVQADSLNLLEMQVGDIVEMLNGYPRKLDAESVTDKEFNKVVLQRNGKPFFWPESEPAIPNT